MIVSAAVGRVSNVIDGADRPVGGVAMAYLNRGCNGVCQSVLSWHRGFKVTMADR
jgi:hypothetical protein